MLYQQTDLAYPLFLFLDGGQELEQPQSQTLDLAALVEQLQKSPELASILAALLTAQKAG